MSSSDPEDYGGGVFPITFDSPNNQQCLSISITSNDNIFEEDEVFLVSLSSDDSAIQPGIDEAAVLIVDNSGELVFKHTLIPRV